MATALQTIKDAMMELGILQTQEEPADAEAQDALRLLNQMLKYWQQRGITLNHTDAVLTDTLPYPQDHDLPISMGLAVYMAAQFGVTLRPDTVAKADDCFDNLLSLYGKQDSEQSIYTESY